MRNNKPVRPWMAAAFVLCLAFVFAFSMHALAKGPPDRPEVGDCCVKPADASCSSCNGVWLCGPPYSKGCSCVCKSVAEDYGCPWNQPVCY
jgi:hypothetical protein